MQKKVRLAEESYLYLYVAFEMYDNAPQVSKKLFGDVNEKPEDITKIFHSSIKKTTSHTDLQEISTAYRYALFEAYLLSGDIGKAKFIAEDIQKKDSPILILNTLLGYMGMSYKNISLGRGKLHTPKTIDTLLFKTHCRNPQEAKDYLAKDKILLVSGIEPNFSIIKVQIKYSITIDQYQNISSQMVPSLVTDPESFEGTKEELFERYQDSCPIVSDNPLLFLYIRLRKEVDFLGRYNRKKAFSLETKTRISKFSKQ